LRDELDVVLDDALLRGACTWLTYIAAATPSDTDASAMPLTIMEPQDGHQPVPVLE
jgi:hypothetical protein